jgi:hypothetical protein
MEKYFTLLGSAAVFRPLNAVRSQAFDRRLHLVGRARSVLSLKSAVPIQNAPSLVNDNQVSVLKVLTLSRTRTRTSAFVRSAGPPIVYPRINCFNNSFFTTTRQTRPHARLFFTSHSPSSSSSPPSDSSNTISSRDSPSATSPTTMKKQYSVPPPPGVTPRGDPEKAYVDGTGPRGDAFHLASSSIAPRLQLFDTALSTALGLFIGTAFLSSRYFDTLSSRPRTTLLSESLFFFIDFISGRSEADST